MYVPKRIGRPFLKEYRFRQSPSTGRFEEKCAATCASLEGVLSVYHGIRLKNCHPGIMTVFLTLPALERVLFSVGTLVKEAWPLGG